jgi:hypothetical protein
MLLATENFRAAELTRARRGMLSTRSAATYVDQLSQSARSSTPSPLRSGLIRRERTYVSRGQVLTLHWMDEAQDLPPWFDRTMLGFADVLTLPAGWDSYRAKTIDEPTIRKALQFLDLLLSDESPAPSVVPLSSGGIQLEWHRSKQDLEILFEPGADPEFLYQNHRVSTEHQGSASAQFKLLQQIIRGID